MTPTNTVKICRLAYTLCVTLTVLFLAQAQASTCIVIGDSQSALSLESISRNTNSNTNLGLVPGLKKGLQQMGYSGQFYAIKGSGAFDWIGAPQDNKNSLIGLKSSEDSLVPFQQQNGTSALTKRILKLMRTGNKTFVDQVFDFHGTDEIDCFVIQLGDSDIFKERAAYHMSELVKHVLGKDKSPRVCAVIMPTFKEETAKDDFPYITNSKKLNYITQVRHHLQKNNLLADCPVVSTFNQSMMEDLKSQKTEENNSRKKVRTTYDGLFYNSHGGAIWAQNILKSRPFSSRL